MLIGALGACTRVPPVRILPTTIASIYIPIFENRSYEPGLEEELTRFAQEEFLVDGRLDVVRREDADAVLVGKLQKFDIAPYMFSRDEFPRTSRILAVADVALYDPSDREKQNPLMTWTGIDVEYAFHSDLRFSEAGRGIGGMPEDPYDRALQSLARAIVSAVILQRPEEYEEMQAVAAEPKPALPRRVLGREKIDTRLQESRTSTTLSAETPDNDLRQP